MDMRSLLCLAFIALGCGFIKASPVPDLAYLNLNPLGGIQAFAEPNPFENLLQGGKNLGSLNPFFGGRFGGGDPKGIIGLGGGLGDLDGGLGGDIDPGVLGALTGGLAGLLDGLGGDAGPLDGLGGNAGPLDRLGGDSGFDLDAFGEPGGALPLDSGSDSESDSDPGYNTGYLPPSLYDQDDSDSASGLLPGGGGNDGFGLGGLIPGGEDSDEYSDEVYEDGNDDDDDGDIEDDDDGGFGLGGLLDGGDGGLGGLGGLGLNSLPSLGDLSLGNLSLPSLPDDFSLGNFSLPDDYDLDNITLPDGGIPDGYGAEYLIGNYSPMDYDDYTATDEEFSDDSGFNADAAAAPGADGATKKPDDKQADKGDKTADKTDKTAAKDDKKDAPKNKSSGEDSGLF